MSPATAAPPRRASAPLLPFLSALAVTCASFALCGVLSGFRWLPYVLASVLVVAGVGVGLRALRAPRVPVALAQLVAVCCLAVVLFSDRGVLAVLPGPAALRDLGTLLSHAVGTIRSDVAPVPLDLPLSCLIVLATGVVAVLVDVCVTVAEAPAVAGLPLLCVYAVPASLDDDMLPWWSFALGAAGFSLVLAVDKARKRWRWRGGRTRATGPLLRRLSPAGAATPVAGLAIGAVGLLLAVLTGAQATVVGTRGSLPGGGSGGGKVATGQLGINPFTRLRGMLDQQQHAVTLFRVSGLDGSAPYLRALTLDRYLPDKGWVLRQPLPSGVHTGATLPPEPGTEPSAPSSTVTITPVHWDDLWLPVYGTPRGLLGTSPRWHYDSGDGIVYSTTPARPDHYVERADLTQPTPPELRTAGTDYGAITPHYLDVPRVDPDVVRLARHVTAQADTPFDKAVALTNYFTDPSNGFTYSTRTAPAKPGQALHDFLFDGKQGFCEQYASAMAVMLREVGVPSRVAIGFTGGTVQGDHRTITSLDAHAWDEVYFPGYGWLPFDPTPLDDGRKTVPSYLATAGAATSGGSSRDALQPGGNYDGSLPQAAPQLHDPGASPAPAPAAPAPAPPPRSPTGWLGVVLWCLIAVTVLLAALAVTARRRPGRIPGRPAAWTVAAAAAGGVTVVVATAWAVWWLPLVLTCGAAVAVPPAVRAWRRRRHLHAAARPGPGAAPAAWNEVLAEHTDRGGTIEEHDTARITAGKIVRRYHLDEEGQRWLRSLVQALERAWYGGDTSGAGDLAEMVRGVHAGLARSAPLTRRARWFPRSVLRF